MAVEKKKMARRMYGKRQKWPDEIEHPVGCSHLSVAIIPCGY